MKKCAAIIKNRGFQLFAFILIACIISVIESNAQTSVLKLPDHITRIENEAFMNDSSIAEAIIPNGCTSIGARAFKSCSKLKWVSIPTSVSQIGEDAFYGCDDVVLLCRRNSKAHQYAQENHIRFWLGDGTTITSITQDGAGYVNLAWNAAGDGDTEYAVYEQFEDGSEHLLGSVHDHTFRTLAAAQGTHSYYVRPSLALPGSGKQTGVKSTLVSINVQIIWRKELVINSALQTGNDTVALRWGGISPISDYAIYEQTGNNYSVIASGIQENDFSITGVSLGEHTYTIRGRYVDGEGREWLSPYAQQCLVKVLPPLSVPQLVFANGDQSFSTNPSEAPEYTLPTDISAAWGFVSGAETYSVTVDRMISGEYVNLLSEDDITNSTITLETELFSELTEPTICRFGITAVGKTNSPTGYSYFTIIPQDTSILLNGRTGLTWDRARSEAGSRSFAVSSALEWSASTSADWISLKEGEDELTVSVKHMSTSGSRTGTVTVTNGQHSAVLTIHQNQVNGAPVISFFEEELSTNPDDPTRIPAGSFELDIAKKGARNILLELYEKNETGKYVSKVRTRTEDSSHIYTYSYSGNAVEFSAGKEFRIEVSGHYGTDIASYTDNETPDDTLYQQYYFVMTDEGHDILINGVSSVSLEVMEEDDAALRLKSKNVWNCTQKDGWLSWWQSGTYSEGDGISLAAEPNYTGQPRTGNITFSSGLATAVIHVSQPDMTPRMIKPSGLSQSASAPTTINTNFFEYEAIGAYEKYEVKEGSSWTVLWDTQENDPNQKHKIERIRDYITGDSFESGKTYRITFSDKSGRSTAYYIKAGSSSSASIEIRYGTSGTFHRSLDRIVLAAANSETIQLNSSSSWTASSGAGWLSVSPASGTSGNKKSLTISSTANTTGAARTGVISFKQGSTVFATLTVTQDATDTLSVVMDNGVPAAVSSVLQHAPGKDSTSAAFDKLVVFTSGGAASVQSGAAWIQTSSSVKNGSSLSLKLAENTTGSSRTGTLTITYGNQSKTITITQEPSMGKAALISPAFGTDQNAPTVTTLDGTDITVRWNAQEHAERYRVYLIRKDNSALDRYIQYVPASGISTESTVFPSEWFDPDYTGVYCLRIYGIDAYGNVSANNSYYFTRTVENLVLINRKTAQTWANANDQPCSSSYTVVSSGTWTASADKSWIHVGPSSGASGSAITVSLDQNNGSARNGTVTVTSGSASATISIQQCAVLREWPEITSPIFSQDMYEPTVLNTNPSSITVTWLSEPQANWYRVRLQEVVTSYKKITLASSDGNSGSSYTFNNLSLTPGKTYALSLERNADLVTRTESRRTVQYFTVSPTETYLSLRSISLDDNNTHYRAYYGGSDIVYVQASGAWSVSVSDYTWMQVSKGDHLDLEVGEEDYAMYTGQAGDYFCLSILPNTTGNVRIGTVTVRTPGQETSFIVEQDQYYELPRITSPVLGTKSSAPARVSIDDLYLNWTAGAENTGKYTVTLYEKSGTVSYRDEVWNSGAVSRRTATIPSSILKENTEYKIRLETKLVNSYETVSSVWYFRTGSVNELTLNANVDWSQLIYGGYVDIMASAAGGAGGYQFAYALLLDGVTEQETTWGNERHYQFRPRSTGTYLVKVYVQDSAGEQQTYTSEWEQTEQNLISLAEYHQYTAELDYSHQFLEYRVVSAGTWTLTECPDWITPSATTGTGGDILSLGVERNESGRRTGVVELISTQGYTGRLTIIQEANEQAIIASPKLASANITYPARDGANIPYGDITVSWEPVPDAAYYVVSLRELDTDTLLMTHEHIEEGTTANLPTSYFTDNMQYRLAVGAVPEGEESDSTMVGWSERIFYVQAEVLPEETYITGTVYRYKNDGTDDKDVIPECTVSLYIEAEDDSGDLIFVTSTVTDENGTFLFPDCYPGRTYQLSVPSGIVMRSRSRGNDNTTASLQLAQGKNNEDLIVNQLNKDMGGNGLTAEYFQYDGKDKDKIFTDANLRWYDIVHSIDFKFIAGQEPANGKIRYNKIDIQRFDGGVSTDQNNPIRYVTAKFGARYNGYIKVPADGMYQFRLVGDDGVTLMVKSKTAKKWGSGSRNIAFIGDKNSIMPLVANMSVPIEIEYYNKGGDANLKLEYRVFNLDDSLPGHNENGWTIVPASWLYQGKRTYHPSEKWLDHADDIQQANKNLKKYEDGTIFVQDVFDGTIMPLFENSFLKEEVRTGTKGFLDRYGKKAMRYIGKSLFKALLHTAIAVGLDDSISLTNENDLPVVWEKLRDAALENFYLKCEQEHRSRTEVLNDSNVQEVLCIDWPDNWYDQLKAVAKLIDAVKKFGTSNFRDYLVRETSAIMQHYYLVDFDYYKAEDDYYSGIVYEKQRSNTTSFAGMVKELKLIKEILNLVNNAVDTLKKNNDFNHVRSLIMLKCKESAETYVAGSSLLFSQTIPIYMANTLAKSYGMGSSDTAGVNQINYEELLNSIDNPTLILLFHTNIRWDTQFGNWEELLYKQLLLDVFSCARAAYPISDLKSLFN